MEIDSSTTAGGNLVGPPPLSSAYHHHHHLPPKVILVESRSWRDRNLKFGPNYDLEVDNLEKNKKFGEAKPSQIFYFFPNYPPPDHNLWAKF